MPALNDSYSRRQFIGALAKVSGALPLLVTRRNTAAASVQRIGFLIRAGYPQLVEAFSGELARLGLIDGETIIIEKRFSQPDSRRPIEFWPESRRSPPAQPTWRTLHYAYA